MYDDQFMLDKERVARICLKLLAKPWKVTWKAEARVDGVDRDILTLMARAGCRWLAMGVDSADPHGLAYLRKKSTPEMVRRAFAFAKRAKIRTLGYFILGIPVESWSDDLRTIRFSRELDPDIAQFSILPPYPGTPLFDEAKKCGWYRRIPALNYFVLDLERPVVVSPNWSEERLHRIVTLAQRAFFFRPRFLLRAFQQLWALGNVRWLLETGLTFIRHVLPSGVK